MNGDDVPIGLQIAAVAGALVFGLALGCALFVYAPVRLVNEALSGNRRRKPCVAGDPLCVGQFGSTCPHKATRAWGRR